MNSRDTTVHLKGEGEMEATKAKVVGPKDGKSGFLEASGCVS